MNWYFMRNLREAILFNRSKYRRSSDGPLNFRGNLFTKGAPESQNFAVEVPRFDMNSAYSYWKRSIVEKFTENKFL